MAPSQLFQPVKTAPSGAYSFFHPPHGLCVRFGVEKGLDGFLVLSDRKGPKAFAKHVRAKGVADQPWARLSCACTREDIRRNGMMFRHRLTGKKSGVTKVFLTGFGLPGFESFCKSHFCDLSMCRRLTIHNAFEKAALQFSATRAT